MNKKIYAHKFWLVTVLSFILVMSSTNAFAWGGRDRDDGGDRRSKDSGSHGREVVTAGHQRYNYHDGRFYKPGWFWFEIAVVKPPLGAVVTFLPFGHSTVVIGGLTYYHYNNIYYKACPAGYVVVPVPVVSPNVVATQNFFGEKVTVNIPNSNGSYTTITLVKQKDGYIGPQGEYYPGNPTIDQLRALYGK